MWLLLNDSFVNIVADRDQADCLMVTARLATDIPRLFPDADVIVLADADYRYRAFITRDEVAKVIAARITAIDYDEFKGSIAEPHRYRAYRQVFDPLLEMQQDERR